MSTGQMLENSNPKTPQTDASTKVVSKSDKKPKSIPLDKITVEEDKKTRTKSPESSVATASNYEFAGLLKHLEIKHPSGEDQLKLGTIWSYLKDKHNATDDQDVILQYVKLRNKLGSPRVGESSIDRIYRFIKIRKQQEILKEEAKNV